MSNPQYMGLSMTALVVIFPLIARIKKLINILSLCSMKMLVNKSNNMRKMSRIWQGLKIVGGLWKINHNKCLNIRLHLMLLSLNLKSKIQCPLISRIKEQNSSNMMDHKKNPDNFSNNLIKKTKISKLSFLCYSHQDHHKDKLNNFQKI